MMETNDNFGGIAKDNSKNDGTDYAGAISSNATHAMKFDENDGMTAASARNTKQDSESLNHDSVYDASDKPGSKYNINDQAYSQSSKDDFVKTVSNFEHSDGTHPPSAIDSKNLSPD